MKTLLLLLFPTLLFAQDTLTADTCKYKTNEIDEFTGTRTVVLATTEIAPYVYCTFARSGDLTGFYISTNSDLGCVASDSYVILLYEDGKTETIKHLLEIDCSSPSFFGLISKGKKVAKMRIHFSTTLDITVGDQNFLIEGLKCIQ